MAPRTSRHSYDFMFRRITDSYIVCFSLWTICYLTYKLAFSWDSGVDYIFFYLMALFVIMYLCMFIGLECTFIRESSLGNTFPLESTRVDHIPSSEYTSSNLQVHTIKGTSSSSIYDPLLSLRVENGQPLVYGTV